MKFVTVHVLFRCYSSVNHFCQILLLHHASTAAQSIKLSVQYRGADKSLARTGRKQATGTEDFDFHISYLSS